MAYGRVRLVPFLGLPVFIFLAILPLCRPESVLALSPETLFLSGGKNTGTLTINCSAANVPLSEIYTISIKRAIYRSAFQDTEQEMGFATKKENMSTAVLTDYGRSIPGARITGHVNLSWIEITLTEATCIDEGIYSCITSVFLTEASSFPSPFFLRKEFAVDVAIGNVTMTVTPTRDIQMSTLLRLLCDGHIGEENNATNITWVWQLKEPGGQDFQDYQPEVDIKTNVSFSDPDDPCQVRQQSSLNRMVTAEDLKGREYRCFVRRNGRPLEPVFFGNYVLPVVSGGDESEESAPASNASEPASNASAPASNASAPAFNYDSVVAGGVAGGLAVLVAAGGTVFVFRRYKSPAHAAAPQTPETPQTPDSSATTTSASE